MGPHSWQEEKQQQKGFPWASFQLRLPGCPEGFPGESAGCEGASPAETLGRAGQRWIPLCCGAGTRGPAGDELSGRAGSGKFFYSRRMALLKPFCPTAHC